MIKSALLAGAPCDVLILTGTLIAELVASGHVLRGSAKNVGVVKTGVAVKSEDKTVDGSTPEKLKTTLQRAKGIYFPNPVCANSTQPEPAAALIALMASADTVAVRLTCGFEA